MDIYFVLDRSGSMYNIVDDTIGGFNSFVDNQRKINPEGNMSLYIFNDEFKTVYENKKISTLPKFTHDMYWPQSQTALLDAIGKTIKIVEKSVNENHKTIVILTDGEENFSSIYTKAHVNDLIDMKRANSSWTFVFLGANQDAIKEAGKLGIPECSAMTFDPENTQQTFEGLSVAVGRQLLGETQTVEFSNIERSASQASPRSSSDVFTGVVHDSVKSTWGDPNIHIV